ncbi:MAG: penicillin-binding protein activator [Nitrospiria bacterium]
MKTFLTGEVDSKRIVYGRLAKIHADRGDYLSSLKIMLRKRELTDDPSMYTILENEIALLIREKLQLKALESVVEEFGALFPADEALIRLMSYYDEQGDYYREEREARRFLKRFPEHHHSQRVQNFLNRIGDKIKAERYLIALLLPLSGKLRDFGNSALQGAELAIQFFKEAFPEVSVGLIVRDLQEDPSQIRITLEGWLNTYLPIAIVGPLLSKEVNRIAPVVERANIALITPGATARDLASLGNAVFRNAATNRFLCNAIAEYAVLQLSIVRFAVLYPEEGSGRRWIDCFSEGVQKLGGKVVLVESYSLDETDFTKTIGDLRKEDLRNEGFLEILEVEGEEGETEEIYTPGFEGIFLPADAVRAGLIIPQLIFHDYDGITLLGTNSWNSSEFLNLVGPYAEGAVFADGFFKDSPDLNVEMFVREYEERYNETPDLFAAQSFDATRLILNTLTEGALTPQKVKMKVANTIDFSGVSGFVYEMFEGEAIKEPFFIQVQNGRFVQAH